jgi:tetratricopeptide (TPR) repeat protein
LELSKLSQDHRLYAASLYHYGLSLCALGQYEEALKQLRLAREAFLHASEPNHAAYVLYHIGRTPLATVGYISESDSRNLSDALAEFQSLADPKGIALCQMALSMKANAQSLETIIATRESCISNNLPIEQASCTQHLTELCGNLGRLDEAVQWGLIALEESRLINDQMHGAILWILGSVWISLGDYDKAVDCLMEGIKISKAYGGPLGTARILFQLGRVWMKKGHGEDAREAFTETLMYHEMFKGSWKTPAIQTTCAFYFEILEGVCREPNTEEQKAFATQELKESTLADVVC